jgi:hypothetical protein
MYFLYCSLVLSSRSEASRREPGVLVDAPASRVLPSSVVGRDGIDAGLEDAGGEHRMAS